MQSNYQQKHMTNKKWTHDILDCRDLWQKKYGEKIISKRVFGSRAFSNIGLHT